MNAGNDVARYIEQVCAGNIFIHLDTYHMRIEEKRFATGFADAASCLGGVQVSESPAAAQAVAPFVRV
jgi:D-psicose/D-tagatose/L-ribulose 3-epimerase